MPVGSQSRRASIYLATGNINVHDDNNKSLIISPSSTLNKTITQPSTPIIMNGGNMIATGSGISPLINPFDTVMANNNNNDGRRNSIYQPKISTSSSSSSFITSEPSSSSSSSSLMDNNKTMNLSTTTTTSFFTNHHGYQTIEQMLNRNDQNQLPILLYIRNYNEYRRHKPAEARLAARRRERAEAREIRLREIERQQKEMDEQADRHYELMNSGGSGGGGTVNHINNNNNSDHIGSYRSRATPIISRESRTSSYTSSRRSSQESLDMCADSPRELRHYAQELEEKFRKAMINNAQLDNEKQSYVYQIDLYKDEREELEENYLRLQRDFKEKSRNFEQLKRDNERLQFDFKCYKEALEERERLIKEADLVIICNNGNRNAKLFNKNKLMNNPNGFSNGNIIMNENHRIINGDDDHNVDDDVDDDDEDFPVLLANNLSLISKDASLLLEDVSGKTLESKLKNLMLERRTLQSTINELKSDLDDERNRASSMNEAIANNSLHLTTEMQTEIQREANKMTNDLRYKFKKCEQDNATLSSTVNRLENQLARCKLAADQSERLEEELKLDKRKAQRELREALTKIEELESANAHLQKRIDKLKSNRNIIGIITNGCSTNNNNGSNTPPGSSHHQHQQSPPPSSCASDISSTLCSTSSTND
ncbi:Leucine-rich repeat flightless-interacting protein [Dermatophagoides farinae]|uniref:Leucine-rich repeat flightless-interacting protein n=1 Tax=Dermatophagoides farinae TaxID=6954 RepID=A0A922L2M5_DERFA|nr:Leucine-rich repeat flightless-interacting protein [Dermatophagoides farinae]